MASLLEALTAMKSSIVHFMKLSELYLEEGRIQLFGEVEKRLRISAEVANLENGLRVG